VKKKLKVARPLEAISKASARDHRVDRRGTRTAMARRRQNAKAAKNTKNDGATVGYEAQLWQMADALRGSMDAAEYKHVVLGLMQLRALRQSPAFATSSSPVPEDLVPVLDPHLRAQFEAHLQ
jgi:type I restriction enzyme M protein